MDVDLRDLELLNTVAATGTLTAAAELLYVSQPALSQRLTRLEGRLGSQLFDRQGRGLVPNAAGQRMLLAARQVLAELDSATRDVREMRDGRDRRVRLAVQCSTTFQWLPPVIQGFRARCPGAEVRIESLPADTLITALLEDRLDIALITKPDPQMDRLRLTALFDDEMVAVVPADHPWAGLPHLTARDFDDAHLVLYDLYDPSRVPSTPLPVPHGARPARITTMPVITDLLIEMVASGQGVTVLPQWVASPYVGSHGLALVRIGVDPTIRTWYCATRPGTRPALVETLAAELTRQLSGTAGLHRPAG
ncbi:MULTISPECIES: LysR family transcriptional regulator [unclassified Kitasatospora]|uniref:LysR family transcriptional regulator n=1 Tax=unclassified Kitasatospora TaxID=2633591 RepID=UPI00070AD271|nr:MULTISPECIES: LysR family transcriptional regulator [unclassified Kitasatospora]KQV09921.1 LysR family transcriptional regulator [Kitasatospora sp. Root107]KRB70161.1 LysR family transcriptional regulator [Kitasatospora sp. Root187]